MIAPAHKHWTEGYIGLPYLDKGRTREGVDCWGLPWLVYPDQLGIDLPAYTEAYTSTLEAAELDRHIADVTHNGPWTRVEAAQAFDLVTFRRGRYEAHVGIVVKPWLMLHIAADDCAKLEHYSAARWCHRQTGIYRHVEMVSRAVR